MKKILTAIRDFIREAAACAFVLCAVGLKPWLAAVEAVLASIAVRAIQWLVKYIKGDIKNEE